MMAATDGQVVLAAARWCTDEVLSVREFAALNNGDETPRCELVKFVRGQFGGLGVPHLPNPSLHSHAVLATLGKTLKVATQSVKFKDGKRNCSVSNGVRFAIPESYPGYFEILSEEGKAVKCIESVAELSKKFPECVLVRENVRGFVTTVPLSELSADKSRTISAGEILTLQKQVTLSRSSRSHRFLQCTDTRGDLVYLNVEQRGKFSPIARDDNISGVHTLRQLVSNKRLPLMVRLVWGPPPYKQGSQQPACSELRLLSAFEEDALFAMPLGQHSSKDCGKDACAVVALPTSCNLKLVRARNHSDLRNTEHLQRLSTTATRLAEQVNSRMTVLDTFKDSISFWNISPNHSKHAATKVSSKNYFIRRSVSHESQIVVPQEEPVTEVVAPTQDFLEIDQIYDYVRGFAPLPKNLRSNSFEEDTSKPQPPPIETIPTNKHSVSPTEKKSRKIERQRIIKPPSKTALKMELHAQNLAQESLRSSERVHSKRLFKSKTTSSLADLKVELDLSSTHLLTQADLQPNLQPQPTYENLEKPKQKATSEIAHKTRENSASPQHKKVTDRHNKTKKIQISSSNNVNKTPNSKSHEDLGKCTKVAQVSEESSSSPANTPESSKSSRRRRLSKQRSMSSLLAEASPHTPVIEHRPVELHLHLSRPQPSVRHHRATKLGILYL